MNFGLVVVLTLFLLFAFGTGNSLGQWYCAQNKEEAGGALISALVNLLLAGLFGYYAYYIYCQEQREKYTRVSMVIIATNEPEDMPNVRKIDPNAPSLGTKEGDALVKGTPAQEESSEKQ